MDRIKNIYISALALLAFGVAACTEVEPIEMQVNGAEKDYSAVKAFKSSEHPVSLVWMDTWSTDGNMSSYLSSLPDSLDIVAVGKGYEELTVAQQTDLDMVRKTKGTAVVVTADYDALLTSYQEAMTQAEMDGEDNAYEAAEQENPEGTPSQEEIDAAVALEQGKVQEEYAALIAELQEKTVALMGKSLYDGILFRAGGAGDEWFSAKLSAAIDAFSAFDGLFIFEGAADYFSASFAKFDYIVSTSVSQDRISAYQEDYSRLAGYDGFAPEKYLAYISLDDSDYMTPYPDVISSKPLVDPKYKTLAQWTPSDGAATGGLAVRLTSSEASDGYPVLRKTIQYLQLK